MSATIVNGRITGTRSTVWDVYHYLESGHWTLQQIADILRVSLEQVQAAVAYIEANKEAVLVVHRQIEERNARGNPPEVEAQLDEAHERLVAWVEERRRQRSHQEVNGEGPTGRH